MISSNFLSCFFLIEYILIYHRLINFRDLCEADIQIEELDKAYR